MTDESYMRLAMELAAGTEGQTSPNPCVGAVVVKDGRILGVGAHLRAGTEHAEVHALTMAGDNAGGGTIYVTLEPCSHFGRTPPCADLIIEKGIKRAVIAVVDPNPEVAGKGVNKLTKAGITVETNILKEEAEWLNRRFFHYIRSGTPYVTLKAAASLDGKTATKTGESQWITSIESREDGHRLRHVHDAILVGSGTLAADNPSLTTRIPNGGSNPVRVILDTSLSISEESSIIVDKAAPVWVFCGMEAEVEKEQQLLELGVKIFRMSSSSIRIQDVLHNLARENIMSLYVEGGATVHGSFLEAGAIQEAVFYLAPKLIGGKGAPSVIEGNGAAEMAEVMDLDIKKIERIGPDLKITALPRSEE
ncbi:bifunctional diaminohydroxyphosphoribosylaminopyrimidine deaminase/5-amino-6-(5-phosphoribosylamino)uracil reductase RibD [Alteribacillus sp. HJP-4]|uniref:bifunctional diaminohydroxyphosphoribosylaminopyrimidine deaminase/5-amino-6-(5-phosphoribosylamino)uracil reductase RibD n=1 Tax=Alteribacillus sp. HJP-4 TaxID=2775394 RepID=UPI0035CD021D